MTITYPPGYRELEIDSTNEMMDYDGRRVLGRYPDAALHAFHAGSARRQMGNLMYQVGYYARAAEDWLSAAECYYYANAEYPLRVALDQVRKLARDGRIPSDRRDLWAFYAECEAQQRDLAQKVEQFREDYRGLERAYPAGDQKALQALLGRVRELPGLVLLHTAIFAQAYRLRDNAVAGQYLEWARKLDPVNPYLLALKTYHLLGSGQASQAAELGRALLEADPEAYYVRGVLAQALASDEDGHTPDLKAAIEVLGPLVDDPTAELSYRLSAIGLSAQFYAASGNDAEYRRLIGVFEGLTQSLQDPGVVGLASNIRQYLLDPGVTGSGGPTGLSEPVRTLLFRTAEQFILPATTAA